MESIAWQVYAAENFNVPSHHQLQLLDKFCGDLTTELIGRKVQYV